MSDLPHYNLFIDGQWSSGSNGQTMESINPANGEVWATFDCASAADVDRAVAAAKRAFWSVRSDSDTGPSIVILLSSHSTIRFERFR